MKELVNTYPTEITCLALTLLIGFLAWGMFCYFMRSSENFGRGED